MDMVFPPVFVICPCGYSSRIFSGVLSVRETEQPNPNGSLPNMGFDSELATNGALAG
jgi:hypothetical protein